MSQLVWVWLRYSHLNWDMLCGVSQLVRVWLPYSHLNWDMGRRELAGTGERMSG